MPRSSTTFLPVPFFCGGALALFGFMLLWETDLAYANLSTGGQYLAGTAVSVLQIALGAYVMSHAYSDRPFWKGAFRLTAAFLLALALWSFHRAAMTWHVPIVH